MINKLITILIFVSCDLLAGPQLQTLGPLGNRGNPADVSEPWILQTILVEDYGATADGLSGTPTNNWDELQAALAAAEAVSGRDADNRVKIKFNGYYAAWSTDVLVGSDNEVLPLNWGSLADVDKAAAVETAWSGFNPNLFEITGSYIEFEGTKSAPATPTSGIVHYGADGARMEAGYYQRYQNWVAGFTPYPDQRLIASNNKVYQCTTVAGDTINEPVHTLAGWADLNGNVWTYVGSANGGTYLGGDGLVTVKRGFTFFCAASSGTQEYITLDSLDVDGTARPTGLKSWYTYTDAVDQWDTSHKGFVMGFAYARDNLFIQDCKLHDYRGEVVYAGGYLNDNLTLTDCDIYGANSSAISTSATISCTRVNVYDFTNAAIESVHYNARTGGPVMTGTYIDCTFDGNSDGTYTANNPYWDASGSVYQVIVTGTEAGCSVSFDGCTINGTRKVTGDDGYFIGSVNDVSFDDCDFTGNGARMIQLYPDGNYSMTAGQIDGFSITNSTIDVNDSTEFFITYYNNPTNVVLENNAFTLRDTTVWLWRSGWTNLTGSSFSNNTFTDSGSGSITRVAYDRTSTSQDLLEWSGNSFSTTLGTLQYVTQNLPNGTDELILRPERLIVTNFGDTHPSTPTTLDIGFATDAATAPEGFEFTLRNESDSSCTMSLPNQSYIKASDRGTTISPGNSIRLKKVSGVFAVQ